MSSEAWKESDEEETKVVPTGKMVVPRNPLDAFKLRQVLINLTSS